MTLKDKNDVKGASGGYWYRCSRVEFVGDAVKWELNPQSRYSFFDAYVKKPHLQFIEAKDDDALRNFVRAWTALLFYPVGVKVGQQSSNRELPQRT